MSNKHPISWTNFPGYKGETWNPIVGCSKVSPGCDNCYAERMARRLHSLNPTGYYGAVIDAMGKWNGKTASVHSAIEKPLHWKKPRAIFVGSMTDLFHVDTPDEWIDRVFAVAALCPQHLFIILTKRADRMEKYFSDEENRATKLMFKKIPLPNVILGVTAENQAMADQRIPHLLRCPAACRFVSVEPMLGKVRLDDIYLIGGGSARAYNALSGKFNNFNPIAPMNAPASIDWVICGGESGPGARAMNPDWARDLRDQCQEAAVPFFFKQWGEWKETYNENHGFANAFSGPPCSHPKESDFGWWRDGAFEYGYIPENRIMRRLGRRKTGDVLDGRQHHEWPSVAGGSCLPDQGEGSGPC